MISFHISILKTGSIDNVQENASSDSSVIAGGTVGGIIALIVLSVVAITVR